MQRGQDRSAETFRFGCKPAQVVEAVVQQVPTTTERRAPTSATEVALQLSRQLAQFNPWDQEAVWRAVAGVEPASFVEAVPATPAVDGESKALQRLQERIEAAQLSAIDEEEQVGFLGLLESGAPLLPAARSCWV